MNENKCMSGKAKDQKKESEMGSKFDSNKENLNAMDQMNQKTDMSDCGCGISDDTSSMNSSGISSSDYSSMDDMGFDQPADLEIVEIDILSMPTDDISASSDFSDSDYQSSIVDGAEGCGCGDSSTSYSSDSKKETASGMSGKDDITSSKFQDKNLEVVGVDDDASMASGKTCKR